MDDFSIVDERLHRALENLRMVNRCLGGNAAVRAGLRPFLRASGGRPLRILDVGTGIADLPEHVLRWADRRGIPVEIVGLDANPATVDYARAALRRRLPPRLQAQIRVDVGDALDLPYDDDAFDVVTASLFLHHFRGERAVALLREMGRVARRGLVVNDLHRHVLAYYGIVAVAKLFPVSPMFAHDGPLSVLRGFTRDELAALAAEAGFPSCRIFWHWAFRWVLVAE